MLRCKAAQLVLSAPLHPQYTLNVDVSVQVTNSNQTAVTTSLGAGSQLVHNLTRSFETASGALANISVSHASLKGTRRTERLHRIMDSLRLSPRPRRHRSFR